MSKDPRALLMPWMNRRSCAGVTGTRVTAADSKCSYWLLTNPTKSEAKQLRPDNSQESLTLISLSELSSSIPTACLLDPILPFIRTFMLVKITLVC